jgi:hypothetical protein
MGANGIARVAGFDPCIAYRLCERRLGQTNGQREKNMARMRELDPTRCISNLRDVLGPYGPEEFEKYAEGVRKAGLPE